MQRLLLLTTAFLGMTYAWAERPVKAADPVDVALVLVDDVSGSINDDEYKLEKQGYYAAFTNPGVVSAIQGGPIGAIAVMFVEFAGSGQVENVVNWTVVRDADSARAFAQKMEDAPRSSWGHTAIGDGITMAVQDLDGSGITAARRIIDVAGDGNNNSGRPVEVSARRSREEGDYYQRAGDRERERHSLAATSYSSAGRAGELLSPQRNRGRNQLRAGST